MLNTLKALNDKIGTSYPWLRHMVSALGGFLVAVGLMKSVDLDTVLKALDAINTSLTQLGTVFGPAFVALMAWLAQRSANKKTQQTIAEAIVTTSKVPGTTIITQAHLADSTPAANVVSNDEVRVVPKAA